MKTILSLFGVMLGCWLAQAKAEGAALAATYEFTNSLNADQAGVPALTQIDPLGQHAYLNDPVLGDTVYRFSGNASPATEQAGLSLNTTGLISPNNYSVEMFFSFDAGGGYRRVIDVMDRQSDSGFYVDPNDHLTVFPSVGTGPNDFSDGIYHHVVLTVASDGTIKGYIDGLTDFTGSSSLMNISNSATNTMSFFLDNTASNAQTEFSSGKIAQLRLYNGVLTDAEALQLSQNPLVPEPSALVLLALGVPALQRRARGRRD